MASPSPAAAGSATGTHNNRTTTTAAAAAAQMVTLWTASDESPWAVDAVCAIPKTVMSAMGLATAAAAANHANNAIANNAIANNAIANTTGYTTNNNTANENHNRITAAAAAAAGRWKCVCILPDATVSSATTTTGATNAKHPAAAPQIFAWYATGSLRDQKRTASHLWKLHWPNNNDDDDDDEYAEESPTTTPNNANVPLLVSMVSPTPETAFFYAVHPISRLLVVYKLQYHPAAAATAAAAAAAAITTAINSNTNHATATTTRSLLFLDAKPMASVVVGSGTATTPLLLTALAVHWSDDAVRPGILVGASDGSVYSIAQTKVPLGVAAKLLVRGGGPAVASSLLGRFWSSSSNTFDARMQQQQPVHSILHLSTGASSSFSFATISTSGTVRLWTDVSSWSNSSDGGSKPVSHLSLLDTLSQRLTIDISTVQVRHVATTEPTSSPSQSSGPAVILHCIVWIELPAAATKSTWNSTTPTTTTTSRLYWLCLSVHEGTRLDISSAKWLDRFVDAAAVQVEGMAVASNGVAYAALRPTPDTSSVVFMAAAAKATNDDDDNNNDVGSNSAAAAASFPQVWEVDVPASIVQTLLPNSMTPDVVTHGVTALDSSGWGLRIRLDESFLSRSSPVQPISVEGDATRQGSSAAAVATLTAHLQSTFSSHYARNELLVRWPPSIENATPVDLEAAVLKCAHQLAISALASLDRNQSELRTFGGTALTTNSLDIHFSFIAMLQQSGIYRDISPITKWSLLSLGQSIAVFLYLLQLRKETSPSCSAWEREKWSSLSFISLDEWLANAQRDVLSHQDDGGGGDDHKHQVWTGWLSAALDAAMTFREERSSVTYDCSPSRPPLVSSANQVPIWTSTITMQKVLSKQLDHWRNTSMTGASLEVLENVVQKALISCSDTFLSCPNCANARNLYVDAQKNSFHILRMAKGKSGDELLFGLSVAHRYFCGICQVSFEHLCRSDHEAFAIEPLFQQLEQQNDVETNMSFGQYVLKWHIDRKAFGHVLDYGKLCPQDLNVMLNSYECLAPYRWIHSVRQGDYSAATDSILDECSRLKPAIFNLKRTIGIASMTSCIVERESVTRRDASLNRRRRIENIRELINAQEDLFGSEHTESDILYLPDQLCNRAIEMTKKATDKNDRIEYLRVALAICITVDDDEKMREGALLVWLEAIVSDVSSWRQWLLVSPDLTDPDLRNRILNETVFGGLIERTAQIAEWKIVSFQYMRPLAFNKMCALDPLLLDPGMQRLLQSFARERLDAQGLNTSADDPNEMLVT